MKAKNCERSVQPAIVMSCIWSPGINIHPVGMPEHTYALADVYYADQILNTP